MKVKVLGCYGGNAPGLQMTGLVVNGCVGFDAGSVTAALPLKEQEKVRDIFVSHAHMDHTCTLPFLIDNNFSAPGFSLRVYSLPEVVASLKDDVFNNRAWPDFTRLPSEANPVLRLVPITTEEPIEVSGIVVRAINVSHNVPAAGFMIEDAKGALGFTSDTGPTGRFWEIANAQPRLKAIITETSFPNEMEWLAKISGHLTPEMLGAELTKLRRDVPVYIYGLKPRFVKPITKQLSTLPDKRVRLLVQGKTYSF